MALRAGWYEPRISSKGTSLMSETPGPTNESAHGRAPGSSAPEGPPTREPSAVSVGRPAAKVGQVRPARSRPGGEPSESGPVGGADSRSDASGGGTAGTGGTSGNKRRRGSRGGRNRARPDAERSPEAQLEYDRRPADLPDPPYEGVPSPEAAARANVYPNDPGGTSGSGAGRPDGRESGSGTPRSRSANKRRRTSANAGQNAGPNPDQSEEADAVLSSDTPPAGGPGRTSDPSGPTAAGGSSAESETDRRPRRPTRGAGPGRSPRDSASDHEGSARRRGLERNGRPLGRYLMCVHTRPEGTQIAVLEGRSLIEHYVSRPSDNVSEIHGNIYVGRVQNVLPGMEAAFVDIATPKNAVLYRGDLSFDLTDVEGPGKKADLRIEQILKNSQLVLCQVTKNPIGSKGARLTQEVSLPGRFVVLVPNSDTYGISKRLGDEERKRLRRILDTVKPDGHGLIVRTAAEGATPDELQRDVQMLLRQWADIEAKYKRAKGPSLLYREPDMAVRVIREEFNRNYRGVVIDDRALYEEVRSYVEGITPELADRVEFFDRAVEPLPLFEKQHVHEQLHKAIDRKVWLPSGGSLIIERTEALTVIDVNTGKNVGSSSLEETVFRNNLEAADEIARQLRLRDIGGIIVIDFIDMETRANREVVIHGFREALARDKTRTQVFDISELGLVEMTRKRISEGLVESLSTTCPECGGRGFVFDQTLLAE